MHVRFLFVVLLVTSAPAWAADSVFVDGAFNGRWGASFPPFIPQIIGPINFEQITETEGIAGMDRLRPGSVAMMCPAASEKREFYGGDYDYQKRGEFFGCTNGDTLVGVYLDFDMTDRGSILIDMTFPDVDPPRWTGTFTNIDNLTGAMNGLYQGNGIATPLARVGAQPMTVSVNGASFSGQYGLAPDSFGSAFGQGLAASQVYDGTMPTTLGGVTATITDSMAQTHAVRLLLVSPTQVNYLIPPGVAAGQGTLEIFRDGQIVATETVQIAAVSPGVFSPNGRVAAAVYLRVDPDGTSRSGLVYDALVQAIPLDFGPQGADLYILLFLTGTRNHTGTVTVTVDGMPVPFAGPVAQGVFDGLDQMNLGPLSPSLAGRGEVEIVVTVDGKQANVVTVAF